MIVCRCRLDRCCLCLCRGSRCNNNLISLMIVNIMMSSIATKLIPHINTRTLKSSNLTPIASLLSSGTFVQLSTSSHFYHTTTIAQRPSEDRDPRIKITLEQLRMAARGSGRRAPICHDQQEKVMNALEAANYEVKCTTLLIENWTCKMYSNNSHLMLFTSSPFLIITRNFLML